MPKTKAMQKNCRSRQRMSCDLLNSDSGGALGACFSKGRKAGSCGSLFITGASIGFKSEQDKAVAQRQE